MMLVTRKSLKQTGKPNLCTMRANLLVARRASATLQQRRSRVQTTGSRLLLQASSSDLHQSHLLAPVQMTVPFKWNSAVVRGSRILMMSPAKVWDTQEDQTLLSGSHCSNCSLDFHSSKKTFLNVVEDDVPLVCTLRSWLDERSGRGPACSPASPWPPRS